MHLLIVSATHFEIRPFLEKLSFEKKQSEQLTTYKYKDIRIDALITGLGMVPTAFYLGKYLTDQPCDFVINAGVAGTFDHNIPLGSVVNVVEDCIPELGAEDGQKFLSIFDLGFYDPDTPPYTAGKLVCPEISHLDKINHQIINKLQKVRGITSNTIRGDYESIEKIKRLAPVEIESMEGAAFFFSCLTAGIPCLQIRAISNRIEERDKAKWDLTNALKHLNKTLLQIIG
jgi:futalosine hydrolase